MPSELKLQITIPGVSAKDYYRVVYSNGNSICRFHKEVNKDEAATATEWDQGKRSVSFRMPLNVPGLIKKIIGSDTIKVVEECSLAWDCTSGFKVLSEPCLDFPGASKFATSGLTTVSDGPDGCQVDCVMQCNAAMPWPMQSTVEAAMMQEGRVTVGKFLDFTRKVCEEDLRGAGAAVDSPVAAPTPARRAGQEELAHHEIFFDAIDEPSSASGEEATERPAVSSALVPYEEIGRDEAALRCLLQIQASCSETAALMRQVQQSLMQMDENIETIRQAVVETAGTSNGFGAAVGAGLSRGSSYSWTLVMCFCLAGVSAGSIVYMRAKSRSGSTGH